MDMGTHIGVLGERQIVRAGLELWAVYLDGQPAEAVAYPEMTGPLEPGDRVLLNTTAVELELGTGGQHFIICRYNARPAESPPLRREDGHILKLRYTPLQRRVLAVEEPASPHHDALAQAEELPGTPVICLGLHSQLAPALGGLKAANPDLRIAYVMTDSAALPLAYSKLVSSLREKEFLHVTVSAGQAFGGDLEAVNLYSGLVAAVIAGGADVIIAGQGPGNVGTATPLGFGGIEQAVLINAAAALGSAPIAVPRISFADPRERHRGISHHTLTVLGRLALAPAMLPLPILPEEQSAFIQDQLQGDGLARHPQQILDCAPGIAFCREHDIPLRSMGRGYDNDPAFFLAAAAAGAAAASTKS
ncbi:MAG: DUF3866 family protein [Armatimonadota bacterium]